MQPLKVFFFMISNKLCVSNSMHFKVMFMGLSTSCLIELFSLLIVVHILNYIKFIVHCDSKIFSYVSNKAGFLKLSILSRLPVMHIRVVKLIILEEIAIYLSASFFSFTIVLRFRVVWVLGRYTHTICTVYWKTSS